MHPWCTDRASMFIATYLTATVALAQGSQSPCPNDLSGKYSTPQYKFSYQSWAWNSNEYEDTHVYCKCIRNDHASRAIYFKWEDTGLEGYVGPGETAYGYDTSPNHQEEERTVPLWFGIAPQEIKVRTVFPLETSISTRLWDLAGLKAPNPVELAQFSSASEPVLADLGSVVSIQIPYIPPNTPLSGRQTAEIIEQHPEFLRTIKMEFRSWVESNGDISTLRYTCRYEVSGAESASVPSWWRERIHFRFSDAALSEAMFEGGSGATAEVSNRPSGFNLDGHVEMQGEPTISRGHLEILSLNGTLLGTLPVRYYRP